MSLHRRRTWAWRPAATLAVFIVSALAPVPAKAATWQRTIGGTGNDIATAVAAVPAGGWIAAGTSDNGADGHSDGWVARFDPAGEVVWRKTFGGGEAETLDVVRPLPDGSFVVAGSTRSGGAGETDGWVMNLDSDGKLLWEKRFGGKDYDAFEAMVETADGMVLAGYTGAGEKGRQHAWAVKLDRKGRKQWERQYTGEQGSDIHAAAATADGGFMFAGQQEENDKSSSDAWLIRVDATGQKIWSKRFAGAGNDLFTGIVPVAGGGFAVAGQTESRGAGSYDAWLVRIDANGALLWDRTYGGRGADGANGVLARPDGGFVVAGTTFSAGDANGDAWVVWADATGKQISERRFGGPNEDQGYAIAADAAGADYALAGMTRSRGAGARDGWVIVFEAPPPAGGTAGFGLRSVLAWLGRLPWPWVAGAAGLSLGLAVLAGYLLAADRRRAAHREALQDTHGPQPTAKDSDNRKTSSAPAVGERSNWLLSGRDEHGNSVNISFGPKDLARASDGLVLGRNPSLCHVVVANTSLSRRHLRFSLRDGVLVVEDLNTTNGTYLNGRRLHPLAPEPLADGASLVAGDLFLRVRSDA